MLRTDDGALLPPRLGVNVDHVATVRQARRTDEPDPVAAAVLAELAGADGITVHLREDRRHIQERDVRLLMATVRHLNFELAVERNVLELASELRPAAACLVPESREEITTEGGLDCTRDPDGLATAVQLLQGAGVRVSIFIDPDVRQLQAASAVGADCVELHTGVYANATTADARAAALADLSLAVTAGGELGLEVHAGHGLTYRNVGPVAILEGVAELNIGHTIVSRAVLVGMERAVREMRQAIDRAVRFRGLGDGGLEYGA